MKINPLVILGIAGVALFALSGATLGGLDKGPAVSRRTLLLRDIQFLDTERRRLLGLPPTGRIYQLLADNEAKTRAIFKQLGVMVPDGYF